jgi:hypothetical protein
MPKFDDWLALEQQAARSLRLDDYRRWCFLVGESGTPQERVERGREALVRMTTVPQPRIAVHVQEILPQRLCDRIAVAVRNGANRQEDWH